MAQRKTKKIIQVPIEADLLERIDTTVLMVAESRAAFIREACRQRLRTLKERELDRRYVAGYRKTPEGEAWSKVSAKLLSRILPKEKW